MLLLLSGFFFVTENQTIKANGADFSLYASKTPLDAGTYHGVVSIDENHVAYNKSLVPIDMDESVYNQLASLVKVIVTGKCVKVVDKTSRAGKAYKSALVYVYSGKKDDKQVSSHGFSAIVNKETPFLGNIVTIIGDFVAGELPKMSEEDEDAGKYRNPNQKLLIRADNSSVSLAAWSSEPTDRSKAPIKVDVTSVKINAKKRKSIEACDDDMGEDAEFVEGLINKNKKVEDVQEEDAAF